MFNFGNILTFPKLPNCFICSCRAPFRSSLSPHQQKLFLRWSLKITRKDRWYESFSYTNTRKILIILFYMDMIATSSKPKPVILTCAQPTGQLTLGNYLGAVQVVSMLDECKCFLVSLICMQSQYHPNPRFSIKMSTPASLNILPADWTQQSVINLFSPCNRPLNFLGY